LTIAIGSLLLAQVMKPKTGVCKEVGRAIGHVKDLHLKLSGDIIVPQRRAEHEPGQTSTLEGVKLMLKWAATSTH